MVLTLRAAPNPTRCLILEPSDYPAPLAKHAEPPPLPPATLTQEIKSPPDSPTPWRIPEKHARPAGNAPPRKLSLPHAMPGIPTGYSLRPCSDRSGLPVQARFARSPDPQLYQAPSPV